MNLRINDSKFCLVKLTKTIWNISFLIFTCIPFNRRIWIITNPLVDWVNNSLANSKSTVNNCIVEANLQAHVDHMTSASIHKYSIMFHIIKHSKFLKMKIPFCWYIKTIVSLSSILEKVRKVRSFEFKSWSFDILGDLEFETCCFIEKLVMKRKEPWAKFLYQCARQRDCLSFTRM